MSLLISLGLILSALHFKLQLYTTHLGVAHSPSGMTNHKLLNLFIFLFFLPFLTPFFHTFINFLFGFLLHLMFLFMAFISTPSSYNHHICVFSLPSKSEPSHSLNYMVKFVPSGNLLWVSHHNC